ncbi:MAG: creatininase family protein [Nannocystaceae bacterium]
MACPAPADTESKAMPSPTDLPSAAPASAEDPALGQPTPTKGVRLADLTWVEAEAKLTPETVVVIPLGAASKEHGPHLQLGNDWLIADYYTRRVLAASDVVMAPTVGFHFYPAFTEFPGSIHLRADTARDLIVDICRSLARHGPRRFYVLNTGVSTLRPLRASAEILAGEGIALRFTDIVKLGAPIVDEISEQQHGTHADEIETSMMLVIAPETVAMDKAVADDRPKTKPGFSRIPDGPGHYAPSGVWGNPTLATRAKGERYLAHMVAGILQDIEQLRAEPISTPAPG